MFFLKWQLVAVAIVMCLAANTLGDIITLPNVPAGTQYRLAFVTHDARNAVSTNIEDYNAFVTAQANQSIGLSALSTTWLVIGSTTAISASDNTLTNPLIETGFPIYTLQGSRIANNNATLWDGNLTGLLSRDQFGNVRFSPVFTGTSSQGIIGPFALGQSTVTAGQNSQLDFGWVSGFSGLSTQLLPMYAISGVLTAVPEPSSLATIAAIAIVCSFSNRNRQIRR